MASTFQILTIPVPTPSGEVENKFLCDSGAAVGDWVVNDAANPGQVLVIADNYYNGLVIGVITEKTTATNCKVRTIGLYEYPAGGLTPGGTVFISNSGGLTTTPPTTGGLQAIGSASTANIVLLLVSANKVTRL